MAGHFQYKSGTLFELSLKPCRSPESQGFFVAHA
jgi:hypothetical protein